MDSEYPRQETFALSFRTWHPTIDAQEMAANLPLPARRICRAGDRRATPSGGFLEGTYKENYFTATVIAYEEFGEDSFNRDLEACIELAINRMKPFVNYLHQLKAAGARSEFFIGWTIRSNGGAVISASLLERLAGLGIALSLDVYGKSTRGEK